MIGGSCRGQAEWDSRLIQREMEEKRARDQEERCWGEDLQAGASKVSTPDRAGGWLKADEMLTRQGQRGGGQKRG